MTELEGLRLNREQVPRNRLNQCRVYLFELQLHTNLFPELVSVTEAVLL